MGGPSHTQPSDHRIQFIVIVFLLLGLLVAGCVTYHVKEPKRGVTDQIFSSMSPVAGTPSYSRPGRTYDWTKLKGNYGLFIFSYKIQGRSGTNFTGSGLSTKIGIRVWEHEFKSTEGDSVSESVLFTASERAERGSYITIGYGTYVLIQSVYKKGRIVYGGTYDIAANEAFPDVFVSLIHDSQWEAFLRSYAKDIVDIPVDTNIVEAVWKVDSETK